MNPQGSQLPAPTIAPAAPQPNQFVQPVNSQNIAPQGTPMQLLPQSSQPTIPTTQPPVQTPVIPTQTTAQSVDSSTQPKANLVQSEPEVSKNRNMQKLALVFLVILLIIITIVLAIAVMQSNSASVQENANDNQQTTQPPTTTEKYTNNILNFEVEVPNGWAVDDKSAATGLKFVGFTKDGVTLKIQSAATDSGASGGTSLPGEVYTFARTVTTVSGVVNFAEQGVEVGGIKYFRWSGGINNKNGNMLFLIYQDVENSYDKTFNDDLETLIESFENLG